MGSRISGSEEVDIQVAADVMTANFVGGGLYFTMTCQMVFHGPNDEVIPCGQRFKFLKHCGGHVICPRCGMQHDSSKSPIREAIMAKPVD